MKGIFKITKWRKNFIGLGWEVARGNRGYGYEVWKTIYIGIWFAGWGFSYIRNKGKEK